MLSGKTKDKNLQTLFKEFYEKAKEIDPNEQLKSAKNSAKSSIGSFSAKLEARRQSIKKMKEDALNIDKEAGDQGKAAKKAGEEKKVDASKDKASTNDAAAKSSKDQASAADDATKQQEATQEPEEETKEPK